MCQKLTVKIKTSMERASCYFIPPALCISSLDLGCSFNSKISRCHFIFETLCTLHLIIWFLDTRVLGMVENRWILHMIMTPLSWVGSSEDHPIASQQDDMTVSNSRDIFRDIVDNCNFGRQNITYDFICLMLWLKRAMSFFLFALGQEWIHLNLYLYLYFFTIIFPFYFWAWREFPS